MDGWTSLESNTVALRAPSVALIVLLVVTVTDVMALLGVTYVLALDT